MSIVLENEALTNRSLTKHFSSLEWRLQENHVGGANCLQSVLANRIASLLAAKAFACSQAVRLGMGIGVDAVEIKGDALTVIKKCKFNVEDKSKIGAYIKDIHQNKNHFHKIYFRHISRCANQTAHIIAIESLKRGEQVYLEQAVPPYAMPSLGLGREPD
ncbi:hypothetical protein Gohar_006703 [Gossypium harknessii]|uniref:RNase H type-1 domain-containing protein n=1 Tax=Gossypium harknessii TaxID=34285 RepID=A0A7J9GE77_9ROSI|nr:hypothetical protein [Gossypium harknessii]